VSTDGQALAQSSVVASGAYVSLLKILRTTELRPGVVFTLIGGTRRPDNVSEFCVL